MTAVDRQVVPAAEAGVEGETRAVLDRCAASLSEAGAPAAAVEGLHALERQIGQPCVVAVVGQVNAGKSTFINALLRSDKAVVGATETTATINHFVYGRPSPGRPVRCYWLAGHVTEETSEFLASLQGHDAAALDRASGIDRLEYLVPTALLRTITLVDTPGTGAVIDEHESRTTGFLDAARRLRARHDAETLRIRDAADAVIYLVGAVARTSDEELLDQFAGHGSGSARAMNTLGVIAKVDLSTELMERRHRLAAKIAGQLGNQLNAVVPVSAALARAIDRLTEDGTGPLERLVDMVRRIPEPQLELLLQNEELFLGYELEGCPVSLQERREVHGTARCEWRVFSTIAESARAPGTVDELVERLREVAGFDVLRRTLSDHFLVRGQMLRCFRIAQDARRILREVWFGHIISLRRRVGPDEERLERFLALVERADGDEAVAGELREYLRGQLDHSDRLARIEAAWKAADRELAGLLRHLGEFSEDFAALKELETASSSFTDEQTNELRALLGMYGTDIERRLGGDRSVGHCVERQIHWRLVRDQARRGSARWNVADRAHSRLGLIIDELARLRA